MAPVQPPGHIQAAGNGIVPSESSDVFRRVIRSLRSQPGIRQLTDLAVTATGPATMSVNVAAGEAIIDGTQNTLYQGSYHVLNDATVNLPVAASDPTNPRIDLVVAEVQDQEYSGTQNQWLPAVITGTPAPTPAAPALPPNSLPLAQLLVGATATTITSAVITDTRVPGTGQQITRVAQNVLSASAASVTFSNIPVYYNTLLVLVQGEASGTSRQQIAIQFNGDTATNYDYTDVYSNSSSGTANVASFVAGTATIMGNFSVNASGGGAVGWIPNYSSTITGFKQVISHSSQWDAATYWQDSVSGQWRSAVPISQIKFFLTGSVNFLSGSTFTIYGYP